MQKNDCGCLSLCLCGFGAQLRTCDSNIDLAHIPCAKKMQLNVLLIMAIHKVELIPDGFVNSGNSANMLNKVCCSSVSVDELSY